MRLHVLHDLRVRPSEIPGQQRYEIGDATIDCGVHNAVDGLGELLGALSVGDTLGLCDRLTKLNNTARQRHGTATITSARERLLLMMAGDQIH